jgi:serine/threonine-protein kinase HipA
MDEVDVRLRIVKENAAALRLPKDAGRISLAGAQAKTALYWDGERWGVPSGRAPNSHILKPAIPGFFGIVENEHLCQNVAARYGLPAAQSSVLELSEPVIVVTRYDRLPPAQPGGLMRRVHQEDFCQALSVLPKTKYQENGGPSVRQCVELLRRVTTSPAEDVERFIKANMFNWYIGGTDAHAKNYSLLIGTGEIRLAPLYDLSTQLPYPEQLAQNLAMKIGEHHAVAQIGLEDWRTLAKDCKLDEEQVVGWLSEMGEALPDHVSAAREQALLDGLNAEVIESLSEQLLAHVQTRLATITTRYFGGG